jgi:hypothetical protein
MGKNRQGPDRLLREWFPGVEDLGVLGAEDLGTHTQVASVVANTGRWNLDLELAQPSGFAVVHSLGIAPSMVIAMPYGVSQFGVTLTEITAATASAVFIGAAVASPTSEMIVSATVTAIR